MRVLDNVEHRAERAEVWVAEASGTVVAAVTLTFAGQPYSEIAVDNELEFRMLAVDPAVQGGGIGRAVVRQVIEHARTLPGIRAISITSGRLWNGPMVSTNPWASSGFRPVTGTCRARMCCCGCSGWSCQWLGLPKPRPTRPVAEFTETRRAGPAGQHLWRRDGPGRAPRRRRCGSEPARRASRSTPLPAGRRPWSGRGENILLDVGSTVGALAHELWGFEKLPVTTPGINTMQELADSEGIEADCLGGRLRSLSQSFVGPLAEAALERMSF